MAPTKNGATNSRPTRRLITIKQKKEIIAAYEQGARIIDLATRYNMATSTIATILKNKEAIKAARVSSGVKTLSTQRNIYIEEMERLLILWMSERQMSGDVLTQARVCAKARSIFLDLKLSQPIASTEAGVFKASRGWFQNFRKRIGLLSIDRQEESVATYLVDTARVAQEFLELDEDYKSVVHSDHSLSRESFMKQELAIPSESLIKQELEEDPGEEENTYSTDDDHPHSVSDENSHWERKVPTEDVEAMFHHWEEFQTLALRWHPDRKEVGRVCNLVEDMCLKPFIETLQKKKNKLTLEKIFWPSVIPQSTETTKIPASGRRKLKVPVKCPDLNASLR
ncbi:tigger transposable element-derived protein 1 [Biomphalaria glabrata]|nr:tigger transposable element-derived protein 1-like [Biomphalaria glabrata]